MGGFVTAVRTGEKVQQGNVFKLSGSEAFGGDDALSAVKDEEDCWW